MREICMSGLMSGEGKRSVAAWPKPPRPSSTLLKAQKNDDLDAEAIAEAASRPTERTALINHLRALLLERGIVAPQGRRKLEEQLSTFADEDGIEALSPRIRLLIEDLRAEWRALDERIAVFDKEFVQMARNEEPVRRLVTIPGIGTINATALVAAVGNARAFRRGRDMAAWLGLTPRQMTSGGKPRLRRSVLPTRWGCRQS